MADQLNEVVEQAPSTQAQLVNMLEHLAVGFWLLTPEEKLIGNWWLAHLDDEHH